LAGCLTITPFSATYLSHSASIIFLAELQTVIASRFAAGQEGSYTAKLHAQGVRRIAQKVGEEGLEVALAGAGESDEQLIGESADLLFHLLVLLQERGLDLARVVEALRQRHLARPEQR
jgi:phosphoribosyl-AMP cyclohydrolase / phosphoribosyl-ATP pyrophosphohydrolase